MAKLDDSYHNRVYKTNRKRSQSKLDCFYLITIKMLFKLVCLLCAVGSLTGHQLLTDQDKISLAQQQFSTELLDKMAADSSYTKNVIFSPYSIFNSLLTVYTASAGNTEKLMEHFLRFDLYSKPNKQYIKEKFLLEGFKYQSNEYELTSADRIYYTPDIRPKPNTEKEFGNKVAKYESNDEINQWVSQQTKGLIPQLLTPGEKPSPPAMVFVNALYFKGYWTVPLLGEQSKIPFTLPDGSKVQTLMMLADYGTFSLVQDKDLDARVISLPYKGNDISMMIILPNSTPSSSHSGEEIMKGVVKKLTFSKFLDITTNLLMQKEKIIVVSIPKFKSSKDYELKKIFQQLGDGEFFSKPMDLTNMFESQGLHVSAVVHQAKVNVFENGTEAAAATAELMVGASPGEEPPAPEEFTADHPFVYIIYDHTNRFIHFMGILNDPSDE